MIRNILLDFDGVVMDSNPVKRAAFAHIFQGQDPALVQALLDYHDRNGGISRYDKIRFFFTHLKKEPVADATVTALATRFSEFCKAELAQPRYIIPDAGDFLAASHARYRLHVVSSADETELDYLCTRLDLHRWFISVHGSPTPKVETTRRVIAHRGYDPHETAMVGDSHNDLEAASANGVCFLGYNNEALRGRAGVTYVDRLADPGLHTVLASL